MTLVGADVASGRSIVGHPGAGSFLAAVRCSLRCGIVVRHRVTALILLARQV